ncbi:MAG: class II glutamine amidotransferase [Thermoplasmatota archaeon]
MCRLFGSLNVSRESLEKHMVSSGCSLLAQSWANPRRLQGDGWGVAHYRGSGAPVVEKSTGAVFREEGAFRRAVKRAGGRVVIAQIRRASNPLGLPRASLLRPENQQPFRHGRWLFAHNGTLCLPEALAPSLGTYRGRLRGTNDSEVYFWLMMAGLRRAGTVRGAFSKALEAINGAWERASAARKRRARLPYIGLNCVMSDGERLYAICKYDGYRPERDDNWLCGAEPPRPLFEMCYRLEDGGRALVVASERTEPGGCWRRLRDGSFLEARLARGRVEARVSPL